MEIAQTVNTVLLVEDDEVANFIAKMMLEKAGIHQVEVALHGQLAIDHIRENCPDFIFLDINMPVMDGYEFLDVKQKLGLCQDTKVAMLTSSPRQSDKDKSRLYKEVIAYLEKPLTTEKIEFAFSQLS